MAIRGYLRTVLHLTAFSQIGVLLRIYLGLVLGTACGAGSWVPCVTSSGVGRPGGALFSDLPANVLGSFFMGLFASSEVLEISLRLRLKKPVPFAALPPDHPLQGHVPLLVGLRTGFCGTLTTFASWVTQMVVMMVGGPPTQGLGTEWVQALSGLLVGTLMALASLVAGQHAAVAVYHRLNPDSVKVPDLAEAAAEAAEPTDEDLAIEETLDMALVHKAVAAAEAAVAAAQAAAAAAAEARQAAEARAKANGEAPELAGLTRTSAIVEVMEAAEPQHSIIRALADGFALMTVPLLTGISLWLAVATNGPDAGDAFNQQSMWLSVLLAPFGCMVRFHLAYLNGQEWLGSLRWFPMGTFAANMLACCLDFVCRAVLVRVAVTPLQGSVLSALATGVGGALSTVSTWVVEVQKLLHGFPLHRHGYIYMGVSLLTAVVLGLLIYGGPVWATE